MANTTIVDLWIARPAATVAGGDLFWMQTQAGVSYGVTATVLAASLSALLTLGTMATQNANAVAITGGAIDGTTIGATTRASGAFTTLAANSTVTFADGATWGTSGLSDAVTYSTSGVTAPVSFAFTNSYSSTSGGVTSFTLSPTMTSVGASSGTIVMASLGNTIGASANNISNARTLTVNFTEGAGYSGTIAAAQGVAINTPTISGTNPITAWTSLSLLSLSNGNGVTSGTITNTQLSIGASSATAGLSGTINNTGVSIAMPTGINAGTTTNIGLSITGNGQTGSATNWAINSTSTAASTLAGSLTSTAFIPSSSTIPTNGLYLTAANTPSIAANSTLVQSWTSTGTSVAGTLAASGQCQLGNGSTNYLRVTPNASGTVVLFTNPGDAGMRFETNGQNYEFVTSISGGTPIALRIAHAASATNYAIITPSNGGSPIIGSNSGGLGLNPTSGNVLIGTQSALATTATTGYLCISACAGTPTGVPSGSGAGLIPIQYDTTANKFWCYNGSWRGILVV